MFTLCLGGKRIRAKKRGAVFGDRGQENASNKILNLLNIRPCLDLGFVYVCRGVVDQVGDELGNVSKRGKKGFARCWSRVMTNM